MYLTIKPIEPPRQIYVSALANPNGQLCLDGSKEEVSFRLEFFCFSMQLIDTTSSVAASSNEHTQVPPSPAGSLGNAFTRDTNFKEFSSAVC